MNTFHQGIGGNCQLLTHGRRQQGAVIANAQRNAAAWPRACRRREETADQLELTERHDP